MTDCERIFLAEDDPVLAQVVDLWLTEAGFEVETANCGKNADKQLCEKNYGCIILDLGLPELDGLEVLQRARLRGNGTPIIVVTARDSLPHKLAGLKAGADDYITKPFELAELEARVRVLLKRNQTNAHRYITFGSLRIDKLERQVTIRGEAVHFSPSEILLLELFVPRAGQVIKRETIKDHLSHGGEEVSINAVEVYVHRLRKKLDSAGIRLKTVRGIGYSVDLLT